MRSTVGVVDAPMQKQHSLWKTPIPYLFGGLAAMLLVIAIALACLACSYRKMTSNRTGETHGTNAGASENSFDEENVNLVIMAGYDKPTFLAIPTTSRKQ